MVNYLTLKKVSKAYVYIISIHLSTNIPVVSNKNIAIESEKANDSLPKLLTLRAKVTNF